MVRPERLTDAVTLYEGDCLEVLPTLEKGSVDAVVTDPPYSSGGAFRGDRTNGTVAKYLRTNTEQYAATPLPDFGGDTRDQRSFFAWSTMWLNVCRLITKPGGALCTFIDWRQLPVMTDAVQAGGWTWRNVATWWKPGVRMQRGRFSGSAEYVVYATNGANDSNGEKSPQNVFACQPVAGDDKEHIAEKPQAVMQWVISVTPKDAVILDPFAGSGATAIAAMVEHRPCILIEQDPHYCEIIRRRVREADGAGSSSLFREVVQRENLFAGAVT